jgi:hypothetical protein
MVHRFVERVVTRRTSRNPSADVRRGSAPTCIRGLEDIAFAFFNRLSRCR